MNKKQVKNMKCSGRTNKGSLMSPLYIIYSVATCRGTRLKEDGNRKKIKAYYIEDIKLQNKTSTKRKTYVIDPLRKPFYIFFTGPDNSEITTPVITIVEIVMLKLNYCEIR